MYLKLIASSPKLALRFAATVSLAVVATNAAAASVPSYPMPFNPNTVRYGFHAARHGEITSNFAGVTASNFENLGLIVTGFATCITGLINQKSSYGDALILGKAVASDTLGKVFANGNAYHAQDDLDPDSVNHAWSTSLAGFDIGIRLALAIAILVAKYLPSTISRRPFLRSPSRRTG
ncbi:hypothetical protein EUV02_13405 [Polymorphobacter arshaanensis]|uniref:Uncharacterized protein n=1 Tax=Glacieibacterium arshaanense TaxID=2511025 RepID=A0A4Y9EL94_9SPHN|nr:hypothetical protein [Polymorphobacter arshaanensis]TFU01287.1 hypothetical protein EUV02_13405 [Polymorphobacter arshaanensis]